MGPPHPSEAVDVLQWVENNGGGYLRGPRWHSELIQRGERGGCIYTQERVWGRMRRKSIPF